MAKANTDTSALRARRDAIMRRFGAILKDIGQQIELLFPVYAERHIEEGKRPEGVTGHPRLYVDKGRLVRSIQARQPYNANTTEVRNHRLVQTVASRVESDDGFAYGAYWDRLAKDKKPWFTPAIEDFKREGMPVIRTSIRRQLIAATGGGKA